MSILPEDHIKTAEGAGAGGKEVSGGNDAGCRACGGHQEQVGGTGKAAGGKAGGTGKSAGRKKRQGQE
eukprot:12717848-Prorocentrum_lima.AAC.1